MFLSYFQLQPRNAQTSEFNPQNNTPLLPPQSHIAHEKQDWNCIPVLLLLLLSLKRPWQNPKVQDTGGKDQGLKATCSHQSTKMTLHWNGQCSELSYCSLTLGDLKKTEKKLTASILKTIKIETTTTTTKIILDCQADFDVDNVQRHKLVNFYRI